MGMTRVEWSRLLHDLDEATRALGDTTDVPPAIARLVEGLTEDLHARDPHGLGIDPYLSSAVFAAALLAMKALRHDAAQERRRDVRIALEQLRHVVRDVSESVPVADDRPIKEGLAQLVGLLAVPQPEVAVLLKISPRHLQRRLSPQGPQPEGADAARIRVVARIADQLRHVFTGPGVVQWFRRPHPRLGRPPLELLDDPLNAPRLLDLALSARAQGS
ncbi:MAG: hypothetical protein ACOYXW_01050 [Actinomycetota bacterium]